MEGKDFYLDMQTFSWTKAKCFVANGRYTPEKDGKYEEYSLYVENSIFRNMAPEQESVDKLIEHAKRNYKFDSVDVHEKQYCTWLTFNNLVA